MHQPQLPMVVANTRDPSVSPSQSSGSGAAEARDNGAEEPMDIDGVEAVRAKSPERSRLLQLSTTVLDAGPENGDNDVYDYGMFVTVCTL